MKAVIQRVSQASVSIDLPCEIPGKSGMHKCGTISQGDKILSSIKKGLLILVGIEDSDTKEDIEWLSGKITRLRIFNDNNNVMNLSVKDVDGEILVISQFTLHASTKKGNRPSYIRSSKPEIAIPVYEKFIKQLQSDLGKEIKTGEFGAMMQVSLVNDGPVTIVIDTKNKE